MSTYDWYEQRMDPTPKTYRHSGPFASEESLKTVAEALAFCERKGLDPATVRLAHNFVLWDTEETPEEVEARIERARSDRDLHLRRISEMFEEYTERGLYQS